LLSVENLKSVRYHSVHNLDPAVSERKATSHAALTVAAVLIQLAAAAATFCYVVCQHGVAGLEDPSIAWAFEAACTASITLKKAACTLLVCWDKVAGSFDSSSLARGMEFSKP